MNNENTLHGAKLWEKSVHVTEEIDRFTVGHVLLGGRHTKYLLLAYFLRQYPV